MSDQIVSIPIVDIQAPPPLAPLTHVVISPANIAAEQRERRAATLTWGKRWRIRRHLRRLEHQLKRSGYNALSTQIRAIRGEYKTLYAQFQAAKQNRDTTPDVYKAAGLALAPVHQKWQVLLSQYRQLEGTLQQKKILTAALEEHEIAVKRDRLERQLIADMEREAKIYETIIIDRWTRLGYCHRYTKGKNTYTEKVQFSQVGITLDAVYFKIDASYQTLFNNFKTNLPDGVWITDLIAPKCLDELTTACQRRISAVSTTHNGAWVIVHRLEAPDGLMKHVFYEDVMTRYPEGIHDRLPICVGVGANRQIQWVNIADFPHWLIAGYTGAGKSNMVNVLICTLISRHKPDDLRLTLIDLKGGLEFSYYEKLPHLYGDIVDHIEGVADKLAELEAIMGERFKAFRGVAKRIEEYHLKRPTHNMPRLVAVFDEVASIEGHGDLTKRINASLRNITQKGRAVGIHIILCTQRPDTQAIPGNIKANLVVRISGRMTTSADSLTILGNSVAKELASIPGRMMLQIGPDPQPVQTPHIDESGLIHALKTALAMPKPTAQLIDDENAPRRIIHQQWTPERIIELSIKHLGGNVGWKPIYEAADGLTQAQARELVEKIWQMEYIEYEGKQYIIKRGKGHQKHLIERPDAA